MAAVFTDANFEADVINSDKLSMVDFWAPWCGPCLAIGPTIDALATEYAGKVNIGKLNIDDNPKIPSDYDVRGIPCILFIKGGKVVDKHVGSASRPVFEKKIKAHM